MSNNQEAWQSLPLSDVTTSISNGLTHQNNPASGGLPLSRIQTISKGEIDFELVGYAGLEGKGVEKYLLNPGDILFSHINSKEHVGKVAIYKAGMSPLLHGMNLLRIVANEKVLPKYLFWAFRSDSVRNQIWDNTRHAVNQASINIRNLSNVVIPVPPLDEQRRIVETLDDHLSRLDKALAEVTSALQKFETLERSAMAAHFSTSAESALVTLAKIADVTEKAKSIDPKSLGSEAFKYVDIGSISPDSETPNVSEWTSTSTAPSRARQHIKLGDVVFSTVRPYQKKIAIVKEELDGHIASTGFCVLRPIPGVLDTRYLFHYLKSDLLMDQVLPLQRGASYPAVGDSDVKNSTIPLPDLATQIAIAEELDSVVGIVKSLKSQLHDVAKAGDTMRRTILHSAFSGKLLEEK